MIEDKEKLLVYLDTLINSVFKILPLYEENNIGVETYVESLLFELYGVEKVIDIGSSYEYIVLLSTLESVRSEVAKKGSEKKVIKREVFKCISIVKNISNKIENGE
mgnify:FL=1